MPRGGRRPGAGRPKGARDKFNVALHERLAGGEDDPAEILIGLMRHSNPSIALRAAKALMPHVYPKLSVLDASAAVELPSLEVIWVKPPESESA
jgi:hypothetical protein